MGTAVNHPLNCEKKNNRYLSKGLRELDERKRKRERERELASQDIT